jgi:hypothetical protein
MCECHHGFSIDGHSPPRLTIVKSHRVAFDIVRKKMESFMALKINPGSVLTHFTVFVADSIHVQVMFPQRTKYHGNCARRQWIMFRVGTEDDNELPATHARIGV